MSYSHRARPRCCPSLLRRIRPALLLLSWTSQLSTVTLYRLEGVSQPVRRHTRRLLRRTPGRSRTCARRRRRPALCPLSYGGALRCVDPVGFEPTRACLQGRCSPGLSYEPSLLSSDAGTRTPIHRLTAGRPSVGRHRIALLAAYRVRELNSVSRSKSPVHGQTCSRGVSSA